MFTFFCFTPEIPFLGKFRPKIQNYLLKVKLGAWTYSNIQNSIMMFTFSVLDRKYVFWANLVQNVKIVSLTKCLFSVFKPKN